MNATSKLEQLNNIIPNRNRLVADQGYDALIKHKDEQFCKTKER